MPPPSPQRAPGGATPTSSAVRPLLRRRQRANLNLELWPPLDERRGSGQFAHSFILSGPQVVTFIERPGHGDYQAKPHSYSLDEFLQQAGLAVPVEELSEFANAAFKADLKANKSPKPPRTRRDRSHP